MMLALALPCHMQSTAHRNNITDGQEHWEHWESRQGSGAKLWFLRNQGLTTMRCTRAFSAYGVWLVPAHDQ